MQIPVSCRHGFISREQLRTIAEKMGNNGYGNYLLRLAGEDE